MARLNREFANSECCKCNGKGRYEIERHDCWGNSEASDYYICDCVKSNQEYIAYRKRVAEAIDMVK